MGFIFMGLASGTLVGAQSALTYICIYIIMIIGVFSFLLNWKLNSNCIEEIQHLSGISNIRPVQSLMFSIIIFSMAGIPPFGGFFAKLSVFSAAAESKMYLLMIVAAIFSVISAVYYLRIIK